MTLSMKSTGPLQSRALRNQLERALAASRMARASVLFGAAIVLGIGCRSTPVVTTPLLLPVSVYPYGLPSAPVSASIPGGANKPSPQGPNVSAAVLRPPDGGIHLAQAMVPQDAAPATSPTTQSTLINTDIIDLGIALRLAGVDNPTINLARERVEEAAAEELAARALLLPSVTIGGNYHRHHGALETSFGYIRRVDSQSIYTGLGARTLAAESVAFPGVRLFAHLGDAAYAPLAARQRLSARQSDAQAVQNTTVLAVVSAYLDLVGAETRLAIRRQGETEMAEVLRLSTVYAKVGQGRKGEVNRAAANAALLAGEIQRAEEEVAVAAAELARLLSLDPGVRLRTPIGPTEPVRLMSEDVDPETLIETAGRSRPEIFARSAEILEARVRVRQEQVRPWVPTLSAGYSYGAFGGGSNLVTPEFGPLKGRSDFDVFAVWSFQNLGFGNRARAEGVDALVVQAVARLDIDVNRIRREVTDAQAEARAAARQLEVVRPAVITAEEGFRLEKDRVRQGEGRPIELLDSFRQLIDAQQELVRATIAFNIAQFRLFVAVGGNPLTIRAGVAPAALRP